MTTYEILKKLKNQILELRENSEIKGDIVTDIELMRLRVVLKKLNATKKNSDIRFISEYADVHSIFHYFFGEEMEYDQMTYFTRTIDPWLIELIENDYNIVIEKISPSEKIESFYSSLLVDMDNLEKSYFEANYSHVTALSSKILSAVFKQICQKLNIEYSANSNHMQLYGLVRDKINLNPSTYKDKELQNFVNFTSSIGAIIKHLNQLRNLFSDSHGVEENKYIEMKNLKPHHFKLIVDTTKTIANFIVGTYNFQHESDMDF